MHVTAHLNIDLLAHNANEEVTCLVNLQAPVPTGSAARPGQTLVVVLDRSGSMGGAPIEGAKEAIASLVRRLAPQDAFGLVVFDDQADLITPVRTMADHHLPSLLHAIEEVGPGGSTDISAGYLLALREVKRSLVTSGHRGATVLLVSDGDANAGIQEPQELDDLALGAFRSNNITTSTLGLGRHYNEVLLAALTHGGGGEHRFAPDIDAAAGEVANLVGNLLDKSVVGVQLRIKRQPGLVSQVLLRNELPRLQDGDAIVVSLGDMYAAEERSVLVKFIVPGLPVLGTATIADLVLEYTTLPELQDHTVTLPVSVNVVPGDEARGRVPNPAVEIAELLIDIASDKQSAGESLRRGDTAAAQRTIASSITSLNGKRKDLQTRTDVAPSLTQQLDEAARELLDLADDVAHRDAAYSSKTMMQSFSANSRGRKSRSKQQPSDTDDQSEEAGCD